MNLDFNGKVVIVTGGAGVIGSAISKQFAACGAKVIVADKNEPAMQATVAAIQAAGGEAAGVLCDVGNKQSAKDMVAKAVETYGRVDVLVNNASVNGGPETRKPIHEYDNDLWKEIINVDMNAVFYCSKPAIQQMVAQGEGGSVVNVSAAVGQIPARNQCGYMAAKAGVLNLTKAMAMEVAPHNVRVNAVTPGAMMDEAETAALFADPAKLSALTSHIPQGKPGQPQDVASMVCYLASDEAKYMTGSIVTIDGGWTSSFARNF